MLSDLHHSHNNRQWLMTAKHTNILCNHSEPGVVKVCPSIHPSTHFLSCFAKEPRCPFLSKSSSGIPRCSQAKCYILSPQCIQGLLHSVLPVGHAWNKSLGRHQGDILIGCLNHFSHLVSTWGSSGCALSSLMSPPHPIPEGESWNPAEENSFQLLVHYPEVTTISKFFNLVCHTW